VRSRHRPLCFQVFCFAGHHVQGFTKDSNSFTSWLVWLGSVVSWLVVRLGCSVLFSFFSPEFGSVFLCTYALKTSARLLPCMLSRSSSVSHLYFSLSWLAMARRDRVVLDHKILGPKWEGQRLASGLVNATWRSSVYIHVSYILKYNYDIIKQSAR